MAAHPRGPPWEHQDLLPGHRRGIPQGLHRELRLRVRQEHLLHLRQTFQDEGDGQLPADHQCLSKCDFK